MTTQEAIKLAVDNGWNYLTAYTTIERTHGDIENMRFIDEKGVLNLHKALLDREFWKALCNGLGWKSNEKIRMCVGCGVALRNNEYPTMDGKHGGKKGCGSDIYEYEGHWLIEMHRLIDHLAEGKDIESFFSQLE